MHGWQCVNVKNENVFHAASVYLVTPVGLKTQIEILWHAVYLITGTSRKEICLVLSHQV